MVLGRQCAVDDSGRPEVDGTERWIFTGTEAEEVEGEEGELGEGGR